MNLKTPLHKMDPPDGFTEDWNTTIWNVGFVFRWSEVFECWLDCQIVLTVRPNQTLSEAYELRMGEPLVVGYDIFFVNESYRRLGQFRIHPAPSYRLEQDR